MIISLINHKGGVGKTTSTSNIGAALASLNKKVLLIDLDSQANLTGIYTRDQQSFTMVDLLNESENIQTLHTGKLDIIPSTLELSALEMQLINRPAREQILSRQLEKIKKNYDFILIDCPPSLGIFTYNAITASDYVLVPMQSEYFSLTGLRRVIGYVNEVKSILNKKVELMGVFLTQYNNHRTHNREVRMALTGKENFHLFETVIRDNVAISDAVASMEDIHAYDKGSNGAKDYMMLTDEILRWIKNRKK